MSGIKTKKHLDLKKVKQIIFDDIPRLLDDLELEYDQVADNIFMCCPIHEGSDNKQAVSISLTKQAWRCWTRGCHEDLNTDIFGFIRGALGEVSFSEALKYVCKLYNVNGAQTDKKQNGKTKSSGDGFADIVKMFTRENQRKAHAHIVNDIKTCNRSLYFESRGFQRETLRHFGVEDCCDKSCPMRYRSIIPIYCDNESVGYIARATKKWLQPKYLFSEGLKKTNYLYNYDKAIIPAQQWNCLFLVEGQGDVWRLHEAECYNAVGLFGKDISCSQRTLLVRSGITTLVVLTDNDQAGRESKIKIKRDMGRLFKLVFPKMSRNDIGDMSTEKLNQQILSDLKGCY